MAESEYIFRVHPAIGMARVGNSEEFYLGPETEAGLPVEGSGPTTGGIPIRPETENETITSSELRDANGAFKRQAARFRIYQYPNDGNESYPNGGGTEITIDSWVGDQQVQTIIWTVHVANKKANTYVLENPDLSPNQLVIDGYKDGKLPPLRNLQEGPVASNPLRVQQLTIDPGPRTIRGRDAAPVAFDKSTEASYYDRDHGVHPLPNYPQHFPGDSFENLNCPQGPIDTLGELRTDEYGRLLVLGGYGRACGWYQDDGTLYPLNFDVDNDGWFDDTSDGPVSAVLVFTDGTTHNVHGGWVVSTDPAYAPQTLNVVSLWDDIYDSWVRKLGLAPDIYDGHFLDTYAPYFDDQLFPIFRAAELQRWNTNLPMLAIKAHEAVGAIKACDDPARTILGGLAFIRNPNNVGEHDVGAPLMPLSLGDQGQAFLSPTLTQYFFLQQWNLKRYEQGHGPRLGHGEYLDRAVLVNCLGGRFSPGIDMTFIVRQPDVYIIDWQTSGAGPFRIHAKELHYAHAQPDQPFLTEGYVPEHTGPTGLEPGDTSKFMAIPWHTDYNSCATHETAPNPSIPLPSTTLYWSWPAQRPVAVYLAQEVHDSQLGPQHYSVRGPDTEPENPQEQGRFQNRLNMLTNWHRIGVILQGSAIDSGNYSPDYYLEVESQLPTSNASIVPPWPINASE